MLFFGRGYKIGGRDIVIGEDGLARLKGTETIAGSPLRINQGLKLLVEEEMVLFVTALNSCTINTARCLGIDNSKGKLAAGYDADIAILEGIMIYVRRTSEVERLF